MKKQKLIQEQTIRRLVREEIKRLDEKNRYVGDIKKLVKKGAIPADHWLTKAKTSGEKVEVYKGIISWLKGNFEGIWDGAPKDNIENGKFKNSVIKGGDVYDGKFDNVTHEDGKVWGGIWTNLKWKGGTWPGRGKGRPIALPR